MTLDAQGEALVYDSNRKLIATDLFRGHIQQMAEKFGSPDGADQSYVVGASSAGSAAVPSTR